MSQIFNVLSSKKQQSAGRHATLPRDIILTLGQPVFLLLLYTVCLGGGAKNANLIVFGLTRLVIKPMTFCTRGDHANHYITSPCFNLTIKETYM